MVPGWQKDSPHGHCSQEWANVGWDVELLVLLGGSFWPGIVVYSHVRCVEP